MSETEISTTIQKTIQESNFEPILVSCSLKRTVPDDQLENEIKKIRKMVQKAVKDSMDAWLNK